MGQKFLLRLDLCVHDEQTSAGVTGSGRLGRGLTTYVGAERLTLSAMFLPKKIRSGQACAGMLQAKQKFHQWYEIIRVQ